MTTKQRHPNCKNHQCKICLTDHLMLGDELDNRCGTGNRVDHLGKYRSWLEKRGVVAETEHGWATEAYFDENNIAEYVREYTT